MLTSLSSSIIDSSNMYVCTIQGADQAFYHEGGEFVYLFTIWGSRNSGVDNFVQKNKNKQSVRENKNKNQQ